MVAPAQNHAFRQEETFALAALVIGAFAIGASPIFVRFSALGPIATAFHRMLWALPLLFIWMQWEARQTPRPSLKRFDILLLPLSGLFFAGDLIFWHLSILKTSVANATVLANFAPVIVALGAWIFFRQRPSFTLVAGIIFTLGGAGILVWDSFKFTPARAIGDIYGLITAFFFGGFLLSISALRTGLPTAFVTFWSSLITCIGLLIASLLAGESVIITEWSTLAVLIALAWISQAAGQGLIAYGLGIMPPALSSLVVLLEPVAAAFLGWLVLAEALGSTQVFGATIIISGIIIARTK